MSNSTWFSTSSSIQPIMQSCVGPLACVCRPGPRVRSGKDQGGIRLGNASVDPRLALGNRALSRRMVSIRAGSKVPVWSMQMLVVGQSVGDHAAGLAQVEPQRLGRDDVALDAHRAVDQQHAAPRRVGAVHLRHQHVGQLPVAEGEDIGEVGVRSAGHLKAVAPLPAVERRGNCAPAGRPGAAGRAVPWPP